MRSSVGRGPPRRINARSPRGDGRRIWAVWAVGMTLSRWLLSRLGLCCFVGDACCWSIRRCCRECESVVCRLSPATARFEIDGYTLSPNAAIPLEDSDIDSGTVTCNVGRNTIAAIGKATVVLNRGILNPQTSQ